MHKIAEPAAGTLFHFVLATTSLSEISDWTQFGVDRPSTEPAIIQIGDRFLGILLPAEFDIHTAYEMVAKIVAHVHLLNFAILIFTLDKDIFKEVVIVFLHFFIRDIL